MAGYGNFIPSQFHQQEKSSLEAAAEAAAKVNAMLIAKGKLRPNQVNNNQQIQKKANPNNMVAVEVEINDAPLSMRNMLTRGPTQEEITKFSGAAVSTRGRYMTPVEKMKNNSGERPLYLFVQGPNQDSVNVAVARINDILTGGKGGAGSGGGLIRTSAPGPPPQHLGQQPMGMPPQAPPQNHAPAMMPVPTMQMPPVHQPPPMMAGPMPMQPQEIQQIAVLEEKLFIGLEHAPPNFDVKGKLLGPGGSYLWHIQTETGAKVMLRGKGSGFIEPTMGREGFEPMHVMIRHPNVIGLQQAKQLAENLIQTVQQMYASFQQVLAASLPPVGPGPTAYITGIQQPTSMTEAALIGPPPGLPTITGLPEAQLVQSAPGLQPQQTVIVPASSMSSVIMPAGSLASSLPTINTGQPGAPGVMMPTTMSLAPVPVVSTLPISSQTHLHIQAPPGALEMGQQQLIVNQAPPPQPLAQVNLPPQMSVQTSMPVSITSLPAPPSFNPAFQPTVQLVSQPAPGAGPPTLAPPPAPVAAPGQPPPFQTMYSPEVVSSGPMLNSGPGLTSVILSSAPSSHIYSLATSSPLVTNTPTTDSEPTRRRFTEEKDDKIPDSLLGYQHGPPHLVNLVCPSPPPVGQTQPGLLPPHPQGQPGLPPHPQMSPVPQSQPVAVLQGQPSLTPQQQPGLTAGQLSLQPGHPGLQPGLPPGHPAIPTIPTSFALQPGIQVQTLHAIPGVPAQLPPPPASLSPVSQPYALPPSSMGEDNRYGAPVASSAAGIMPPPPPPTSMSMAVPVAPSNGETTNGPRLLMPPPASRSETQTWGGPAMQGPKRGLPNGDRGPESDRKRRKENGGEEEENGGPDSPSRDSPKDGTPNQPHAPPPHPPHAYSPGRGEVPPPQEAFDHLAPPPPPPPHHPQPVFQPQPFESNPGGPPGHALLPPGSHLAPQPPQPAPFDPQAPPGPPQFVEAGSGLPPPPPQQYQEYAPAPPPPNPQGELGHFPPPHSQGETPHPFPPPPGHHTVAQQGELGPLYAQGAELGGGPGGQGMGQGAFPPPYSQQPVSQPPYGHYISSPPVSTPHSFQPNPHFLPHHPHHAQNQRHPHGPPPPPPPPPGLPSSQFQQGPPHQAYWHN